jgi:hypothetical protein
MGTLDRRWAPIGTGLVAAVAAWVLLMPPPLWGMMSIFLIPLWLPRLTRGEISEKLVWKLATIFVAAMITFVLIRIFVLDL